MSNHKRILLKIKQQAKRRVLQAKVNKDLYDQVTARLREHKIPLTVWLEAQLTNFLEETKEMPSDEEKSASASKSKKSTKS